MQGEAAETRPLHPKHRSRRMWGNASEVGVPTTPIPGASWTSPCWFAAQPAANQDVTLKSWTLGRLQLLSFTRIMWMLKANTIDVRK